MDEREGFRTFGEMLADPPPELEWLVDGMLARSGVSIVAADPKAGKSTTIRSGAVSIMRGEPFLGRGTIQGPVLHIGHEGRRGNPFEHFKLMGVRDGDPLEMYHGAAPTDRFDWLERQIRRTGAVFAMIDPLFRFVGGIDANDYSAMSEANDPFIHIAERTRCHITALHHARKSGGSQGKEILGSQAILGGADTAMLIHRNEDNGRSGYTIQREGEDLEKSALVLDAETGRVSLGQTAREDAREELHRKILAALDCHPEGMSKNAIHGDVKGNRRRALKAISELSDTGFIHEADGRWFAGSQP